MAARLKIDHELRLGVSAWLRRQLKHRRPGIPTDVRGKPLAGLKQRGEGGAIWMHATPDQLPHKSESPRVVPAEAL